MGADGGPVPNLYASGGVVTDVASLGVQPHALGDSTLTSLAWGWVAGKASKPPEPA